MANSMFEDMEKVVEMAQENIRAAQEFAAKAYAGPAPGHHRPTQGERVQWVQGAAAASPAMPLDKFSEAGELEKSVMASPYLTAVGEIPDGKKELKRAQDTMRPEFE